MPAGFGIVGGVGDETFCTALAVYVIQGGFIPACPKVISNNI
jgi:hypothetical protein